jgi:hypothetical protein
MPKERRSRSPSFSLLPDDRSDQWGLRTGLLIGYRPSAAAGTVRTTRGERLEPRGLTVRKDGPVTVVGYFNYASTGEAQLAVLRYLPSGRLDRSFARKGFYTHHFGRESILSAAITLPDGRVVVAGHARFGNENPEGGTANHGRNVLLMRFRR